MIISNGEELAIAIARVCFLGGPGVLVDARYIAVCLFVEHHSHDQFGNLQVYPTDIQRAFKLSQSSASVLVDKMIKDGWLNKTRRRQDHRFYVLTCTAKALQTLRRARIRFDTDESTQDE